MTAGSGSKTKLAYDDEGAGTPVVFLHGLTFDRRTWWPVVERLGGAVRSIAIDLPAHGGSGGSPAPLQDVAAGVHELIDDLAADRPVVVGHSMSGGIAMIYVGSYPARGLVTVDNGPDLRPFARLARQIEPALRGPGFSEAWRAFEDTLGIGLVPEPERSLVLDSHVVDQDVVVGYWDSMLRTDPDDLQALVDAGVRQLDVPWLAVFGRPITDGEGERFGWVRDVDLEEWIGDGHLVHLVDPDRFAARLRQFVDHCSGRA